MSGSITQPARPDPALSSATARRKLVGKSLDEALYATRGWQVDVCYVSVRKDGRLSPNPRSRGKDHILLLVEGSTNVVKGVV